MNDFKVAFQVFDQCRAALDPVAAIHVSDVAHLFDFCAMNVTADDAIHFVFRRQVAHSLLVFADILHRALGLHFQIGGKRPIAESQAAADAVGIKVQIKNNVIEPGAHPLQQPIEPCQSVKLMPMQHQVALSIDPSMDGSLLQAHLSKAHPGVILKKLIVVAVKKSHFG